MRVTKDAGGGHSTSDNLGVHVSSKVRVIVKDGQIQSGMEDLFDRAIQQAKESANRYGFQPVLGLMPEQRLTRKTIEIGKGSRKRPQVFAEEPVPVAA